MLTSMSPLFTLFAVTFFDSIELVMTNTLRAYKISKLMNSTEYLDQSRNRWILRWPPPRDRQIAEIDNRSGQIIRYRQVTGNQTIECDPINWVSVIDRRINYLWGKIMNQSSNKEVAS